MEIGPILRAMRHNKVKVGLLVVEIAVTVAIVVNGLAIVVDQRRSMLAPTGIDDDNIVTVRSKPFSTEFADPEFARQMVDRDVATLRALPGVIDSTPISNYPLQGGGSSMQVKPMGAPDTAWIRSPVYTADPHFLNALGLELIAGRGFTAADVPTSRGPQIMNIIVTQALADAVFPDGDALGQTLNTGAEEYPDVIVGIVRQMHTPYGGGPMEDRITFYPGQPTRRDGGSQFLVRAEPGQLSSVIASLDRALLANSADRILEIRTLEEVKGGGYAMNRVTIQLLSVIIGLLLFVTGLGIFGITSFAVTQRTRQIGTRRALGAERSAIVGYFLLENSLIAALGSGLGLTGGFALNIALVTQMEGARLSPGLAIAGALVLWLVGVVATLLPARRAAAIPPALATRSV